MNNIAIILASGTGSRFGSNQPKQFSKLGNKTILEYSLDAFSKHPAIDEILLVTGFEYISFLQDLVAHKNYSKVSKVITGGATRQASSAAGIAAITNHEANVLVHDAARPLISADIISRCIAALKDHTAVNTATEVTDTVAKIDSDGFITDLPPRNNLRFSQTPQAFKACILKQAHAIAAKNGQQFTDDCGLVLSSGLAKVFVVEGDRNNLKITYQTDVQLAKQILNIK